MPEIADLPALVKGQKEKVRKHLRFWYGVDWDRPELPHMNKCITLSLPIWFWYFLLRDDN